MRYEGVSGHTGPPAERRLERHRKVRVDVYLAPDKWTDLAQTEAQLSVNYHIRQKLFPRQQRSITASNACP